MHRWIRPVTVPWSASQHLSCTIDDQRCWCAWHSEHRRHFGITVQQVRKGQTVPGDIGFHEVRRFFHIDTQHHESLILVALIERLESSPLSQTIGSPGGPKVHEYSLPFERPQGDFVAIEVRQADLWERNSPGETLYPSCLKEYGVNTVGTRDQPQAGDNRKPEYTLASYHGMPHRRMAWHLGSECRCSQPGACAPSSMVSTSTPMA